VLGRVDGQVLLDHLLGDEADAALPALGRVVEDVVDLELVRVLGRERVELALEEDVGLGDVGVDERQLGLVLRVLERGPDDLLRGEERVSWA